MHFIAHARGSVDKYTVEVARDHTTVYQWQKDTMVNLHGLMSVKVDC